MFRIGVDGGGTTTRAVVIDQNTRVVGRGQAGAGNYQSAGLENAVANIVAAVNAAVEEAGVASGDVKMWGFGLAGVCNAQDQALLREHLLPLARGGILIVEEDAVAAQAGAFGGGPGAICIAGTGANCFGRDEKGETARADGLGPLLGDRGSGYWIGAQSLQTICAMADGCAQETPLMNAVLAFLGVRSLDELVHQVYAPGFTKDHVAALFPVVLHEAVRGDAVAQAILLEAGRHLAATTASVLRRLHLSRVAPCGGVLRGDTAVRAAFEDALRLSHPGIEIVEPQYDAAVGAALLPRGPSTP